MDMFPDVVAISGVTDGNVYARSKESTSCDMNELHKKADEELARVTYIPEKRPKGRRISFLAQVASQLRRDRAQSAAGIKKRYIIQFIVKELETAV